MLYFVITHQNSLIFEHKYTHVQVITVFSNKGVTTVHFLSIYMILKAVCFLYIITQLLDEECLPFLSLELFFPPTQLIGLTRKLLSRHF